MSDLPKSSFDKWKGLTMKPDPWGEGGVTRKAEEGAQPLGHVKKFEIPRRLKWRIQSSN